VEVEVAVLVVGRGAAAELWFVVVLLLAEAVAGVAEAREEAVAFVVLLLVREAAAGAGTDATVILAREAAAPRRPRYEAVTK
jgi:hypothetical protein